MPDTLPIVYEWNGEGMVPLRRFNQLVNKQFTVHETYRLVEMNERSQVSHSHQFAWLKSAWLSLPESISMEYPSPESLRKRSLIQAGFYDETIIDAGSNAAAIRVER